MTLAPGLCAEFPATPLRLFLGTLPSKKVEQRLSRDLLPVHAWFASRKRVKEQANEFLELDLASCDAELMLRYCGIPFIRRYLFHELVDRQLTLIETGKAAPLPDIGLAKCLEDCMSTAVAPRMEFELEQLRRWPRANGNMENGGITHQNDNVSGGVSSSFPSSSSSNVSSAPVEAHDLLFLMREVENRTYPLAPDAEMQARPFFPKQRVQAGAEALVRLFQHQGGSAAPSPVLSDKKDVRLLQRQSPGDAVRIGGVEKMRPADVTAYFRFVGERLVFPAAGGGSSKKKGVDTPAPASFFRQALMGNVFKKIATHPAYIESLSTYWSREAGWEEPGSNPSDVPSSSSSSSFPASLPPTLSRAVCGQQTMFPALKWRAQYLYTSPDIARRRWRTENTTIPLMRLFPLLGRPAAEDLAAALVTESLWAKLGISTADGSDASPLQEHILRELKDHINRVSAAFERNPEELGTQMLEGAHLLCPPVTTGTSTSSEPHNKN